MVSDWMIQRRSKGGNNRIRNEFDWEALLPIAAHTQYWTNPKLGDWLYDTTISRPR